MRHAKIAKNTNKSSKVNNGGPDKFMPNPTKNDLKNGTSLSFSALAIAPKKGKTAPILNASVSAEITIKIDNNNTN